MKRMVTFILAAVFLMSVLGGAASARGHGYAYSHGGGSYRGSHGYAYSYGGGSYRGSQQYGYGSAYYGGHHGGYIIITITVEIREACMAEVGMVGGIMAEAIVAAGGKY